MSAGARSLPRWLAVLLVAEMVLGLAASALLCVVFLAFTTKPTSIDLALVIVVSALPLLVSTGAAALARRMWRVGEDGWAIAAAVVPVALGVPFLLSLLGVGL